MFPYDYVALNNKCARAKKNIIKNKLSRKKIRVSNKVKIIILINIPSSLNKLLDQ